jgi:hypothetical protein
VPDHRLVHVMFLVKKICAGLAFCPSASVYPCHYHSTNTPYLYFIHPLPLLYNLRNWLTAWTRVIPEKRTGTLASQEIP